MNRIASVIAVLLAGASAAACDSQKRDWKSASEANSLEAYQAYLQKHPDGEFSNEARHRLQPLEWAQAQEAGIVESYRQFMARHPDATAAAGAQANIDMADRFALQLVSVGLRSGTSCGGAGSAVILDARALSPNTVAVVSSFTIQGRFSDGRWTGLRRFAVLDDRSARFEKVVLTACMDSRDNWRFPAAYTLPQSAFPVNFLDPLTNAGPQKHPGSFTITFSNIGALRLLLVFEDDVSRVIGKPAAPLTAVRGFGKTVHF